jgi:hypothetical protein
MVTGTWSLCNLQVKNHTAPPPAKLRGYRWMNYTGLARQSIDRKAQYEAKAGGMNHDACTAQCGAPGQRELLHSSAATHHWSWPCTTLDGPSSLNPARVYSSICADERLV